MIMGIHLEFEGLNLQNKYVGKKERIDAFSAAIYFYIDKLIKGMTENTGNK